MNHYDVIVIGGGPSGLMAAFSASENGAKVLLVEKGEKLGRKLIISGGGRCNVTNAKEQDELIKQMPGNGRFLFSAFAQFSNKDIIYLFQELGVELKEEDRGRMFPVTDKAITVANALINKIKQQGVEIRLNSPVERVLYAEDNRCEGILLKNGETFHAPAVVIAVGGCSVPKTGSTGDGYVWAKDAGHTITDLYPTEVPIMASDDFIKQKSLQGISLRDIEMTLFDPKGKRVNTQEGDMIFTHFGISGPAALRIGHYVSVTQKKHGQVPLKLVIDVMPDRSVDEIFDETWRMLEEQPKKAVKNVLKGFLPERLIPVALGLIGVADETTSSHMHKKSWLAFAQLLKAFPLTVTGTLSLEEAFITGGGVHVKEIDPKTMRSKKADGLFFAGEVMDVHAHTGGYNITIAFSSGFVAGKHSALYALEQGQLTPS